MKYCIAVQETLRREIVVEAGSLEDALDHVENEYDKQNIILTADDACVEPDIFEVDWYSEKDIEEMEANYDIRNGSGRISEGWRRHIQHRLNDGDETQFDAYDLAELLDCWVEFCAENGFQTNSVDYVERVCG